MLKIGQQITGHNLSSGLMTDYKNSMMIKNAKIKMVDFFCDSSIYKTPLQQIQFYKKKAKENKVDAVVVRGIGPDSLYAIVGLWLGGCKKILTGIHGLYSDLCNISKLKRFFCKYFIEPFILKKSLLFYTVYRNFERTDLVKKYKKKYFGYIYNPIFHSFSREITKKSKLTFLYVGRITAEKGIAELMNAIKLYNEVPNDDQFVLAGSGDIEKYKKICKEKNVKFLGEVQDVYSLYRNSDVFILPSYHENLPYALLEAVSLGNYCIATKVGGVSEIMENYNFGQLIEPHSSQAIYEAIITAKKVFSNIDSRLTTKFTYDLFSFEQYKNKMISLIEKAI